MKTFAVKRYVPGITMEQLDDVKKSAIEMSHQFTEKGTDVQYIRFNFFHPLNY